MIVKTCVVLYVVLCVALVSKAQWWGAGPLPPATPWMPPLQRTLETHRMPGIYRNRQGHFPGPFQPQPSRTHPLRTPNAIRPPVRQSSYSTLSLLPSLKSLTSLLDPFGLFKEEKKSQSVLVKKMSAPSPSATTTTEAPPPMVYFPDGGDGACEDFSSGGFNTYSFLSFLFSVVNLVAMVSSLRISVYICIFSCRYYTTLCWLPCYIFSIFI